MQQSDRKAIPLPKSSMGTPQVKQTNSKYNVVLSQQPQPTPHHNPYLDRKTGQ